MRPTTFIWAMISFLLISCGSTPTERKNSLLEGARSNDPGLIESALSSGLSPNAKDKRGLSLLHIAAGLGNLKAIKKLVEWEADVNILDSKVGTSVLHKAAISNNPESISYLISHGAFVNVQAPNHGSTPLMDAVMYRKEKNVVALLERGADPSIANVWGITPLQWARETGDKKTENILKTHLSRLEKQTQAQAIHKAVKSGNKQQIQLALRSPSALNDIDTEGNTPLLLATRYRDPFIVEQLLKAGANVQVKGSWMQATPLHKASFRGYNRVVQLLLDNPNTDINAQAAYNGNTALHDAIWQGHVHTALMLISKGASLSIRSHTGQTPLELARSLKLTDVEKAISKKSGR